MPAPGHRLGKACAAALVAAAEGRSPGESGAQLVARLAGVSVGTVSRWVRDEYRETIPAGAIVAVESALAEPGATRLLARATLHELAPLPAAPAAGELNHRDMTRLVHEAAGATQALAAALADGRIDAADRALVLDEIEELRRAVADLEAKARRA